MIKKWNLSDKYADWLMMVSMPTSPEVAFFSVAFLPQVFVPRYGIQITVAIILSAFILSVILSARSRALFVMQTYRTYPPFMRVRTSKTGPDYVNTNTACESLSDAEILSDCRLSAMGTFIYIAGILGLSVPNYGWFVGLGSLGLCLVLQDSKFGRRWRHSRQWGLKCWHIDGVYAVFEFPGVAFNRIPEKEKLAFVTCRPITSQDAFNIAVCDRRPSMYLVGRQHVVPVSYDPERNAEVRQQMEQQLLGRELPVFDLQEEVMPQLLSSRLITLRLLLLAGVYCIALGYLLHLGPVNKGVLMVVVPWLSVVFTICTLLIYAVIIQTQENQRLKAAAADWWA